MQPTISAFPSSTVAQPTATRPTATRPPEHELFMLAGIAGLLHWIEALINILSGAALTVALGIPLVALFTDGRITASAPDLLNIWAICIAVGVDAQLVGTWARVARTAREHRHWLMTFYILLGLALAYVSWISAQIFAVEQSMGLSIQQALAMLHMDAVGWITQRNVLVVGLVVVSALTRYVAPGKAKPSFEDEQARLQRELTLEPLRQQLRQQKAAGVAGMAQAVRQGLSSHGQTGEEVAPHSASAVHKEQRFGAGDQGGRVDEIGDASALWDAGAAPADQTGQLASTLPEQPSDLMRAFGTAAPDTQRAAVRMSGSTPLPSSPSYPGYVEKVYNRLRANTSNPGQVTIDALAEELGEDVATTASAITTLYQQRLERMPAGAIGRARARRGEDVPRDPIFTLLAR